MTDPGRRLTSWKAIASYLGREVRTVMRWEKERDLPVHRGPNGKTGIVFADMDELDAWTRGDRAASEAVAPEAGPIVAVSRAVTRPWMAAAAAFALLALAGGVGGWRVHVSKAKDRPGSAIMTESAVIARNADGSEKWRYEFAGERSDSPIGRSVLPIEDLGADGILAATSNLVRQDTLSVRSGQLLWFDPGGKTRQMFSFEDRLQIGSRGYSIPWSISDYELNTDNGVRLIAVAAHHYEWWPSIVTVLDGQWHRESTFVHAGWVEHVRWLPGHRLGIAGFSNIKDGGMVALLEANAMNGQSPAPPNGAFDCPACGPDRPVRYVIMPRSEVNRVSAAPFNRASLHVRQDTLVVVTMELPEGAAPASANYEFTQQLDLLHATYSDRYWQAHAELERRGRITHTRERCPERDGPATVEIWEPATGWRVQTVRR